MINPLFPPLQYVFTIGKDETEMMVSLYQKDVRDQKGLKAAKGGGGANTSGAENFTIGYHVMKVGVVSGGCGLKVGQGCEGLCCVSRLKRIVNFAATPSTRRLSLASLPTGGACLTGLLSAPDAMSSYRRPLTPARRGSSFYVCFLSARATQSQLTSNSLLEYTVVYYNAQ